MPRPRFAGSRRPDGESVKWSWEEPMVTDGQGQGAAEKANGGQDTGGGGSGSRHECAQRTQMASGFVSVAGTQTTSLANATRSIRRIIRERNCAAVSGR